MSKDSIVLVTQNKHKLAELTPLFEEYELPFETTSLEKFEIRSDSVEEIAETSEAAICPPSTSARYA